MEEAVPVSEGGPTLEKGGVRTAGLEDSRTCVHKPSSSLMAAEITSWKVAVVGGTSGGGGMPTGVGWGSNSIANIIEES